MLPQSRIELKPFRPHDANTLTAGVPRVDQEVSLVHHHRRRHRKHRRASFGNPRVADAATTIDPGAPAPGQRGGIQAHDLDIVGNFDLERSEIMREKIRVHVYEDLEDREGEMLRGVHDGHAP